VDPCGAEIVTLRFYSGLSVPEVASHLGVSVSTVEGSGRMRQATTRSHVIHTAFTTSPRTIAMVFVCENPPMPATQPCTRYVTAESHIRYATDRGTRAVRKTANRKQEHCEPQREVLVAPHSPFKPADGFGGCETRGLFGVWRVRPRVHGLLEGHTVHSQDAATQRQRHQRRRGTESTRPSRRLRLGVQCEERREQTREEGCHACELGHVHGGPDSAAGVGGEDDRVVIGLAAGVEQGHHDVESCPMSSSVAEKRSAERSKVVEFMTELSSDSANDFE